MKLSAPQRLEVSIARALAATNRPEVLDPAPLRAGRFDRQALLAGAGELKGVETLEGERLRQVLAAGEASPRPRLAASV